MKSKISLLKYVFLGVMLIGCTGITAFDLMYTKPKQKCEAAKGWWSPKNWKCYQPIKIADLKKMQIDAASLPDKSASK